MKQEKLSTQMPDMLKKLKLEWVINETKSINLTEFEMIDQVNYVYKIGGLGCATKQQLSELVWKAFKYNAYIPSDVEFPKEKFKGHFDAKTMSDVLTEIRSNWKVTKRERKKQKRDALVAAYSTIPRKTLNKLRDLYMCDFKTFDYDSEPADIFT